MTRRHFLGLISVAVVWLAHTRGMASDQRVIKAAAKVLEEISADPESGFRVEDLQKAKRILIIPGAHDLELGLGRRVETGVCFSRDDAGKWVNPEIVRKSGVSAGPKVKYTITDTVEIDFTQKLEKYYYGISLESGVQFGAHSYGRESRFKTTEPATGTSPKKRTFHRTRGFSIGATFYSEFKRYPRSLDSAPIAPATEKTNPEPAAKPPLVTTERVAETPELAQLRTMLTAMSTPRTPVAVTRAKDEKVTPASATMPKQVSNSPSIIRR